MRQNELELRNLHSQLATGQEKLQQLNHWRNECEFLNQELHAQREVRSTQEAKLREVTIRLEETRIAAEKKQRLLINSEQRLTTQFENLANRIFEHSGRKVDEKTSKAWIACCCRYVNNWTVFADRCKTALDRKHASAIR